MLSKWIFSATKLDCVNRNERWWNVFYGRRTDRRNPRQVALRLPPKDPGEVTCAAAKDQLYCNNALETNDYRL